MPFDSRLSHRHPVLTPRQALVILVAAPFALVALIACIWYVWFLVSLPFATAVPTSFDLDQSSSDEFIGAFARSLAFNHLDNVRAHIDPNKWALISRWKTEHVALAASPSDCSYPDIDITPTILSTGDNVSYILPLLCNGKTIFLTVDVNRLKFQNGKWMITDLASICQDLGDGTKEQCWK
jgi:hypothetical protein